MRVVIVGGVAGANARGIADAYSSKSAKPKLKPKPAARTPAKKLAVKSAAKKSSAKKPAAKAKAAKRKK